MNQLRKWMALKRGAYTLPLPRYLYEATSRRLRRFQRSLGVIRGGAASGTDLGGSSNYSSENLEDRSGEGFHTNSSWLWVSRS